MPSFLCIKIIQPHKTTLVLLVHASIRETVSFRRESNGEHAALVVLHEHFISVIPEIHEGNLSTPRSSRQCLSIRADVNSLKLKRKCEQIGRASCREQS